MRIWVGHVVGLRIGETKTANRILVGKSKWKRLFGKPNSRWKENIKCILNKQGIRCG
jgi:hypothetical protein